MKITRHNRTAIHWAALTDNTQDADWNTIFAMEDVTSFGVRI